MQQDQLAKRLEIMQSATREAGAYILESDERQHTDKTNKRDFVTVADIKSQDILRQALKREFPDTQILSEEDSEEERQALYDPHFTGFILDPIDGTYNYKRDARESGISVGYIENGQMLQGVVLDPYKQELFHARKGGGAFRNGEAISVRQDYSGLEGASVATSNGYNGDALQRNLVRHMSIYEQTGNVPWTTIQGSAVLVMNWVACGRIDAFHHNGLKPWDNAAAFLIVREAGGVVQTLMGEEAPFTSPTVLMGTPGAVRDLRDVFNQIDPELLK